MLAYNLFKKKSKMLQSGLKSLPSTRLMASNAKETAAPLTQVVILSSIIWCIIMMHY